MNLQKYSQPTENITDCLSLAEKATLTTAEIGFNAAGFYTPSLLFLSSVTKCVVLEQGLSPKCIRCKVLYIVMFGLMTF